LDKLGETETNVLISRNEKTIDGVQLDFFSVEQEKSVSEVAVELLEPQEKVSELPESVEKVVEKDENPVENVRKAKENFLIHDYFFAKTLDKVRPGGIVTFITSKSTMDKKSTNVRKYIAQRAELLETVMLPNNAFLKNAGTEVTSDVLFFQKRERPLVVEPDWVHLGFTDAKIPVNAYFAEHPEMILGTMAYSKRMYGNEQETSYQPYEGADLPEQLREALSNIRYCHKTVDLIAKVWYN
jgi:hypothetical protein